MQSCKMSPHWAPSVFGYYAPDFIPTGPIGLAGLTSPESFLLTTNAIVDFTNGMWSLIEHGLSDEAGGIGSGAANGYLEFKSNNASTAKEVIDELDLLLTGGRMKERTKQIYMSAYKQEGSQTAALKTALKLFMVSAAYHTNAMNTVMRGESKNIPNVYSLGRPFKAIVVSPIEVYLFVLPCHLFVDLQWLNFCLCRC